MAQIREKNRYAIRGNTCFTGFSFTIAANRSMRRRDIRQLIGRFLSSEVEGSVKVLIGSDAANCNAWHFVLDCELTEKQAKALEDYLEAYRIKRDLGHKDFFYVPRIRSNAFGYTIAHSYADILEVK